MENINSALTPNLESLTNSGALNNPLGKIFNGSNFALLLIAPNHQVIDVDNTCCQMFGYSKEELLTRTIEELTHPDDIERSLHFISNRKSKGGDLFYIEKRYITKSGDHFWCRVRVEEILDKQGNLICDISMLEDISELKSKEESLYKATQRLQSITDNIPAIVTYIDTDLRYQFVNANYETQHRTSKDKIIGKKVSEVLSPLNWENAKPNILKAFSGHLVNFEDKTQGPTEDISSHALIKLVPDIDSNGKTIGIFIHATDISEAKQQEVRLKDANTSLLESKENMQRMMDASPDTVLVVNRSGIILYANPRIEEMFGYPVEEILGSAVEKLLPSALRSSHTIDTEYYQGTTHIHRMSKDKHLVGQKQNGKLLPIDIGLSEMTFDGQNAELVTIRDVTNIRRTMETNEQLAAIVEASGDAIFKTNTESKVMFWSEGAHQLYGYSSDEMIGEHAKKLMPHNDKTTQASVLEALTKGNHIDQYDAKRMHKDGYSIDVSISIFPIMNTSGDVIGLAAIHRDIREVKHMEDQLRHAQKMETAGQLAGGIAHDFNNILTIIQGYCSLISQELPADSKILSHLNLIENASQRASTLTRQLLTFSRKQRIDPKVFDPKKLILELLTGLQRSLGEHITLKTNLCSEWMIKEDPAQFEQIVLNLLVNARHAMPTGGKLTITTSEITLENNVSRITWPGETFTAREVKPGQYVLLSIADTGSGMSKEVAERIFEPFYTTKPKGEGTGLGLSVVYGLVTQTGGAIHVETAINRGSCFHVFIPRAVGKVQPQKASQPGLTAGMGKILLVEDDPDVRYLTTAILESAGYEVISASEPKEVFKNNIEGNFDLILSDVVMPGMSGPEFAEIWLREHPDDHFLFMSGYADDSILPFASSTDNLVQKPFKPNELLKRVRDAIEKSPVL